VINFQDWPEECARTFPEPFAIVDREVKPKRQRKKPDGSFALRNPLPIRWWQYADKRPAMLVAIAGLERVIALARISKIVMPLFVSTGQVLNENTVVFASNDAALLAILSSSPHYWWVARWTSTLATRVIYSPSDVFETFVMPDWTQELRDLGERLDAERREVMRRRELGLTKLYQ
jgi:hypothetical protein